MSRTCPRDAAQLLPEKILQVVVDTCPTCQGTYLDPMELARILGIKQDLSEERLFLHDVPRLHCPDCNARMVSNWFSTARQVMVDTCPSCRGVWLDGGELKALIREIYGIG